MEYTGHACSGQVSRRSHATPASLEYMKDDNFFLYLPKHSSKSPVTALYAKTVKIDVLSTK